MGTVLRAEQRRVPHVVVVIAIEPVRTRLMSRTHLTHRREAPQAVKVAESALEEVGSHVGRDLVLPSFTPMPKFVL